MSDTKKTWIGGIISAIVSVFHAAEPIVDEILHWADNLVNVIKKAEASDAGQLLEAGIESIWPPASPLINAFKLWLPRAGAILANIEGFEDLSDEQKIEAFLKYLSKVKTADPVLYAGVLTTVNAAVQQFFSDNMGAGITPQQSLAAAQVVHDQTLGVA